MADGGFHLTLAQKQAVCVLAGPQLHTMLAGGARSGKTFKLVRAVCLRAMRAKNSRHAIFRLRYNALRASVWLDTLPKVMRLCFPGVKLKQHRQEGYVEFPNGSQIWFCGLDDAERVEKILGLEFITVYFNECSQIPYSSVLVALTRLAQRVDGMVARAYYDLNPVGKSHWTYRQFIDKLDPVSKTPLKDPHNFVYFYMNPKDNRENISDGYLDLLEAMPERQRRRFLDGRYVDEIEGALWSIEMLEGQRVTAEDVPKDLDRIVVAVDPSGCSGEEDYRSDEIGIVVVGLRSRARDVRGFVLADASGRYSPEGWGSRACRLYHDWKADAVIGEINFGGAMVKSTISAADKNVRFRSVTASRGKVQRAEPVAALYEKKQVYHAGRFEVLEEQLCNFSLSGYRGDKSPDRADAAVWGLTDLMLGPGNTGLLDFYREKHEVASAAAEAANKAKGIH